MTKPTPHGYDGVTEPGLIHDIEQWAAAEQTWKDDVLKLIANLTAFTAEDSKDIQNLEEQVGKLWAYCDQLQPRVTKNEEQIDWLIAEVFKQHERVADLERWKKKAVSLEMNLEKAVARLEDYIETLNADVGLHIPLEPRGPHD